MKLNMKTKKHKRINNLIHMKINIHSNDQTHAKFKSINYNP